ncbi:MAG: dienelactone hydrolase family protein [Flammeovirgaceae bacterium]|nr:dienelactone hydrolase family protein [Flammeovirgaceae bacterium]
MKSIILPFLLIIAQVSFDQDHIIKSLEDSPRHHEWVKVKYGDREVDCFLVYPEVSEKATAVVVIHENRGLNDWARSMADQVAAAGYIAIAPDLLSDTGPDGGNTSSFENSDAARTGIYALNPEQVTTDLEQVFNYVGALPAANGKVAVMGFCWGGSQCFRFATNNEKSKAALVFYGTGPKDAAEIEDIKAPVYGFYGGNDNRVNATIPESEKMMENADKVYEPIIYEGAGHGFMRAGQAPNASEANKKARDEAYERLKKILESI